MMIDIGSTCCNVPNQQGEHDVGITFAQAAVGPLPSNDIWEPTGRICDAEDTVVKTE